MPKRNPYLNNKDLLEQVVLSKEQGEITPKLATMFMRLVKRYGTKPNFSGYTFREDMESDALIMLCNNWHKFDETRFSNAFAYYTQVVHNAFIQTLNKEKRFRDLRDKMLVESGLSPSFSFQEEHKNEKKI